MKSKSAAAKKPVAPMIPMTAWLAEDVMNPEVVSVSDDLPVQQLADLFVEKGISGAPVVNSTGRLVGVVSATDIIEKANNGDIIVTDRSDSSPASRGSTERFDDEDTRRFHLEADGVLVRDIMTPTVFTVSVNTPVSEVARTMLAGHIHRVFVTSNSRMVGIISTSDMLQLVAGTEN